ncbi:MAG: hypothetical protein GX640_04065 [Fibrobacter sp.]|nr:hypothetical protein [Fibrobacter sp.]
MNEFRLSSFDDVTELSERLNLRLSDSTLDKMKLSVENGTYTLDTLGKFLFTLKDEVEIKRNERLMNNPPAMTKYEVTNAETLAAYAKELQIDIPDSTFKKMVQSIKDRNHSPSQLAQYLEGLAYQRFLQSPDVPYISEKRHENLKSELGDRYPEYYSGIKQLSISSGLPEPFIDKLIFARIYDEKNDSLFISDWIKETGKVTLKNIGNDAKSISETADKYGLKINQIEAQAFLDAGFTKTDIAKHILRHSYESFISSPELFKGQIKDKQFDRSKSLSLELTI